MDFKIDDVAKQTGLTKRTIRYYEEIGLITPPVRSGGGVRLYSETHVEQIRKLCVAKEALGFSLQELQQYLRLRDRFEQHRINYRGTSDTGRRRSELESIVQGLQEEIGMIDSKIRRMESFKHDLQSLLGSVREALLEPSQE